MANNCQVAKDIKCRSCNSPGHIVAAHLPTASIRAVKGEAGLGQSPLALQCQPNKQQQHQQLKQAAQINYVQTFPALQSTYPSREAGWYYTLPQQQQQANTAKINAVLQLL